MQVRRIRDDECDKLLVLYAYLILDDIAPDADKLHLAWNELMNNKDRYAYFVIEADDKLVASCNVSIIPNLTRGARPFAIIENVVTHPDYRRKGLGRMVMDAAVEYAKSFSCYKVLLNTNVRRTDAHAFYDSIGFVSSEKKAYVLDLKNV
jgi:GNAT superfamily N-acetyltransferase